MAAEGKSLHVRHGRPEDRDAVLAIDDAVYGGLDYLPAVYMEYCEDPHRIHYILEVDGLMVAYLCTVVVDGGEGVVFKAARTREGHRRLGYQNYLKKEAIKELKTLYPNMKEALWTAASTTPNGTALYGIGEGRRVMFAVSYLYYFIGTPGELSAAKSAIECHKDLVTSVERVNFNKIPDYLQRPDFRQHFEENRIQINWIPYKLDVASNFTMKHRFPDFFGLSHDSDGNIDGVSFYNRDVDEARDWERYDVEINARTREAVLKHMAFNQSIVLDLTRPSCHNVHATFACGEFLANTGFKNELQDKFSVSGDIPLDNAGYGTLICDTQLFSS